MSDQTVPRKRTAEEVAHEINETGGDANAFAGHVIALTHEGTYAIVSPTIMDAPKDWCVIGAERDYLSARSWCARHEIQETWR